MVLSYPCHFRGCERYDLLEYATGYLGGVLVVAREDQSIGNHTAFVKLVIAGIFLICHATVRLE